MVSLSQIFPIFRACTIVIRNAGNMVKFAHQIIDWPETSQ
jgi:hypothetical protein